MLTDSRVLDMDTTSSVDGSVQLSNGVIGSESLGDVLLEDLDSYMEDINDRLMISRMVSDSVIKGMATAVEHEAAERIATKEVEVARLKEALQLCYVGADRNDLTRFQMAFYEPKDMRQCLYPSLAGVLDEHNRIRESLGSLGNAAKEQFIKLKKEIDQAKGCFPIGRISSSSELKGLSGILHKERSETERWIDLDKTLNTMKSTLEVTYKQVDSMIYMYETSLSEWQQQQDFAGELQSLVIRNFIQNLQEVSEERLLDQNAQICGIRAERSLEQFNEISSLRQELDSILTSLSAHETQGCESSEECCFAKRSDHFHRKALSSHVSSSLPLFEGNGKVEDSKDTLPENLESSQLKHLSNGDLFKHFKTEMTEMKRNHESQVQELTEDNFRLKREILNLKERDPLLLKKDREFDILRKRISEVISKLDNILVEKENLPSVSGDCKSVGSFKERLEALLMENRQLNDLLSDKKKEVSSLSSLVSDAEKRLFQHFETEKSMQEIIENLRCANLCTFIEASISEEVFKCVLSEVTGQNNGDGELFRLESVIMQVIYETIFGEAVHSAEAATESKVEDSEIKSTIMQELCTTIFREVLKDSEKEFTVLKMKYIKEHEVLRSLERKLYEAERVLAQETDEKERLKKEMVQLEALIKEKDKVGSEVAAALAQERKRLTLASQDIHRLKELVRQADLRKGDLVEAMEKNDAFKVEIQNLNHKLELEIKHLKEIDEEKNGLLAVVQEKQNILTMSESKERENGKKLKSVIVRVQELLRAFNDFDSKVAEAIKVNNFRILNSSSQLSSLFQKADALKRTGVVYKKRLERKCSDLQKAEAEVDLLGDEVDALLTLLEKIYIALDHYSPVLQHYPGVMEILRLIRRELTGEAAKHVSLAD